MTEPGKWLAFAQEDLTLAQLALERRVFNQACFHAQQGVEKALKGFLRSCQRSVPHTHALSELLAICQAVDDSFQQLQDACLKLDRYYIPTRYPDALPGIGSEGMPTRQDATEAAKLLQNVLEWVQGKIR